MPHPVREISHEITSVLAWLDGPSSDHGIHLATSHGEWQFNPYAEIAAKVERLSGCMRDLASGDTDVVSLIITDPLRFLVAFMATMRAGMIPAPLAPPLTFGRSGQYVNHLSAVMDIARPRYVLCDDSLIDYVDTAAAQARISPGVLSLSTDLDRLRLSGSRAVSPHRSAPLPNDVEQSLLQFTSGSTGTPKGVCVSSSALAANVSGIASWLRLDSGDSFASWLPHYHDMGLIGTMITPVSFGVDLWLMTPEQFIRSPQRWLECMGRLGATITMGPSFGYSYAAKRVAPEQISDLDFSLWKAAVLGAERIDSSAIHRFHQLVGPRGFHSHTLLGAYGLAEATLGVSACEPGGGSPVIHNDNPQQIDGETVTVTARLALGADNAGGAGWMTSCGAPLAGTTVTITDSRGNPLPEGTVGEVVIQGQSLASGYLTSAGFEPFVAGRFATGDAAVQIDGELYVIGRIGDTLKIRGASVYAEDVESGIRNVAGLEHARCAVILGTLSDGQNLAILLLEHEVDAELLSAAAERMSALTSGLSDLLILCGRRGSIARTSSGKPRRRVMWNELIGGSPVKWEVLYGTAPQAISIATDSFEQTLERS